MDDESEECTIKKAIEVIEDKRNEGRKEGTNN